MAATLIEVRREEAADVRRRREAAGISCEIVPGGGAVEVPANLSGLALSGGGVRAASFSLGIVQAFHRHGLLRFFDYLSTVSGGGYVGSYLSSAVLRNERPIDRDNFDLAPKGSEGGKQSARMLRFIYGGQYLRRPWQLLNKYLIGLFFIDLAFLSGLMALCAGAAFLWRSLDYPWFRDVLEMVDLNYDLYAPFLPTVILVAAWIAAWTVSYWQSRAEAPGRMAGQLLVATVTSALVAVALLAGNGDITVGSVEFLSGKAEIDPAKGLSQAVIVFVAGFLLPFLRPARLLKSGLSPTRWWERWVFRGASTALLVGLPLVLVGLFGMENISGYATDRGPDLLWSEVKDWRILAKILDDHAPSNPTASREEVLRAASDLRLHADLTDQAANAFMGTVEERADDLKSLRRHAARVGWSLAAVVGDDNPARRYWVAQREARKVQERACAVFSAHFLSSQAIAAEWANSGPASPPATSDPEGASDDPVVVRARYAGIRSLTAADIEQVNRRFIMAAHPTAFWDPERIFRRVVIVEDQERRLAWMMGAGAVFLLVGLVVDLNSTSLHRFYRSRLAVAFVEPPKGAERGWQLSALRTSDYGAPVHLINATVSTRQGWERDACDPGEEQGREVLGKRTVDSFLFSRRYCGSQITGYERTEAYERYRPECISLEDATALSGAAVSPAQFSNPLVSLLMVLSNLRLGQWLPNPARGKPGMRARVLMLLFNVLCRPDNRRYYFVSDGGFSENLGLVTLLRRRVRLIVAVDASHDPKHQFADLARAIRIARVHGGVQIRDLLQRTGGEAGTPSFQPIELAIDDKTGRSRWHFVAARIIYPNREEEGLKEPRQEGLLIYVKPSLSGDESLDIAHARHEEPDFPHHETAEVLFNERQVESYRALGYHIGRRVAQLFGHDLWNRNSIDPKQVETRLRRKLSKERAPSSSVEKPANEPALDSAEAQERPQELAEIPEQAKPKPKAR